MKIKFEVEGQEVEHEVSESLAKKIQSSYRAKIKRPKATIRINPRQVPIEEFRADLERAFARVNFSNRKGKQYVKIQSDNQVDGYQEIRAKFDEIARRHLRHWRVTSGGMGGFTARINPETD